MGVRMTVLLSSLTEANVDRSAHETLTERRDLRLLVCD
jgi:hypothetical protein